MRARLAIAALVLAATIAPGCRKPAATKPLPSKARPGAAAAATVNAAQAKVASRRFVEELDVKVFQKGNIHTHSLESDGHAPPRDVYSWYREHNYNFLALTDHNTLTHPERFRSLETKRFILIPGEEVTMESNGVPVHVNALCEDRRVGNGFQHHARNALEFRSIGAAMQWSVKSILAARGTALINHPNYKWAFGVEALGNAKGAALLEIYNGIAGVNSRGDGARPSEEAIWDDAWSRGMQFGAVAVDDMHVLQHTPRGGPGHGWVQVFANELTRGAICDGLAKRRLYASTGGELRRFQVTAGAMNVWPAEDGAKVEFLAPGGRVLRTLHVSGGVPATYKISGNEGAVRARVTTSRGTAWTQFYSISK